MCFIVLSGFRAQTQLRGIMGDPQARIITLKRRQKKYGSVSRICGYVSAIDPINSESSNIFWVFTVFCA